jgi:hypothetical protein
MGVTVQLILLLQVVVVEVVRDGLDKLVPLEAQVVVGLDMMATAAPVHLPVELVMEEVILQ